MPVPQCTGIYYLYSLAMKASLEKKACNDWSHYRSNVN
uniref:Uncharacterized protein n=1 Tax=Myoviridae sp. ctoNH1 TaxID=2826695 RepID=A0A8S5QSZ2_9CAUD|nr:MAG TPA: hypothetical protein [Myoviridae sp. ctoNH1]